MTEAHGTTIAHARAKITLAQAAYRTEIRSGRHEIVSDEPQVAGGADAGPNPFALVLAGLGACTAITLRMYAERKQWPVAGIAVALSCLREDKVVRIERKLTIDGLDAEQKQRMLEIADKTPVTLALKGGMPIATTLA
jgi:putative redox protein